VRIVAATNVDMQDAIFKGKFREDLFYRLNTVPIRIPPLRDRKDDIILLFRKFISDFSNKYRIEPVTIDNNAKDILLQYVGPAM
jgi:transcriptional regulator with PAS, ATPase and Fis domain